MNVERLGSPKISIITIVYNDRVNFTKTLRSVQNLTYTDYEYIVWDGGSTDGTIEVIKAHENIIDFWISEPDDGIYDAMNQAVRKARGSWVYFLNAGDVIFDVLHRMALAMDSPGQVVYGDCYWPGAHQLYNGPYNKLKILIGNICHQSIFYPRRVFDKYTFRSEFQVKADYYLNLLLFSDEEYQFKYVPALICYFNDEVGFSKQHQDMAFEQCQGKLIRDRYPFSYYCFFVAFKFLLPYYSYLKRKLFR